MAHFAKINSDGIVVDIIVVNNDVLLENGIEKEQKGKEFIQDLFGSGTWVQTSYNGNIRKNYAGIGYKYDGERDAFIPQKPFESWTLNENTCTWQAPVAYPTNIQSDEAYEWDENNQQWNLI